MLYVQLNEKNNTKQVLLFWIHCFAVLITIRMMMIIIMIIIKIIIIIIIIIMIMIMMMFLVYPAALNAT